jgi:hypothetical protein
MTKPYNESRRLGRDARLTWVPLGLMRFPHGISQRDKVNVARVNKIAAEMDLEQLGNPTVNKRGGHFYVIDGMHRSKAYIKWIGEGWETQELQCWTYHDLSDEEMADRFLKLSDTLAISTFDKFTIGYNAGYDEEVQITRIVAAAGLTIAKGKAEGSIGAVGVLRTVYRRDGGEVLRRALGVVRDAYGTPGLEGQVIDGIGMLCGRYNGQLDTEMTVVKLKSAAGGVSGLLNRARFLKNQTSAPFSQCVAASAVDIINRGRGGKKLPPWWKSDAA